MMRRHWLALLLLAALALVVWRIDLAHRRGDFRFGHLPHVN